MTDQSNLMMTDLDALNEADQAQERFFELYGRLIINAYYMYFPGSGERPVAFDPAKHPIEKRTAMIELILESIPQQHQQYENRMSCATFAADWTKITKPSINALGFEARTIAGRYVKLAKVPGKNPNKKKPGEFYTCFKILQVFEDEAACAAAYEGEHPQRAQTIEDVFAETAPVPSTEPQAETGAPSWGMNDSAPAAPAPAAGQDMIGKSGALMMVKAKIRQVAAENNALDHITAAAAKFIADNPVISKHFTVESPEIMELIVASAAPF